LGLFDRRTILGSGCVVLLFCVHSVCLTPTGREREVGHREGGDGDRGGGGADALRSERGVALDKGHGCQYRGGGGVRGIIGKGYTRKTIRIRGGGIRMRTEVSTGLHWSNGMLGNTGGGGGGSGLETYRGGGVKAGLVTPEGWWSS